MSATRKWAIVGTVAAVSGIGLGTAAYAAPADVNPPAQPGTTLNSGAGDAHASTAADSAGSPGDTSSANTPTDTLSADSPASSSSANSPADSSSANSPAGTSSANTPGDTSWSSAGSPSEDSANSPS
ncbi:hypothetical protein EV643_117132 [Kribbella sp. VKM Ac-2527]|uniref:Uncharacterized protein n=1 Tax=Kribbella caucasensis TaxID=2512215 RepID=A0A4R6K4G2_9ACTN|nr:hypothetical protein [Kribbella sp. VKM Ac-2527]TDO44109.1 hypothetical protein EV643_117132 [Kribbella sp. VKM Ac-2527]